MKEIKILGIESSCDETAASVVINGRKVLSNVISSQIDIHEKFGGVVPEIASRNHIERIDYVVEKALQDANTTIEEIDAIAVTHGPGLVGALLVGVAFAKSYAFANNKPLIGINHIKGHIAANYIQDENLEPPFLCLVVSGGHTYIVHVKDYLEYEIIGKTLDDAIGEAFDKVARAIGLGYPGGPKIDKLAKEGECTIKLPRAKMEGYNFSFSGIKSAVLNYINQCKMKDIEINNANIAASFQKTVVKDVVDKTMLVAKELNINKIAIAGGVAANSALRQEVTKKCLDNGFDLTFPDMVFCTDNAAMIGSIGYFEYMNGKRDGMDLNAIPNLKL